jgi:hypothetical protein
MMILLASNYWTCETHVITNKAFDRLSLLLYRFTLAPAAISSQLTYVLRSQQSLGPVRVEISGEHFCLKKGKYSALMGSLRGEIHFILKSLLPLS